MEKRNSQLEHGQPMELTRGLSCKCDSGVAVCQSQHQNIVSLHRQVSLAAVNQICVIHEAINSCGNLKIH